jgi:hypothetical protein
MRVVPDGELFTTELLASWAILINNLLRLLACFKLPFLTREFITSLICDKVSICIFISFRKNL